MEWRKMQFSVRIAAIIATTVDVPVSAGLNDWLAGK